MNKSSLMLRFEHGTYNGQMVTKINGQEHIEPVVYLDLDLPCKLIIELSGKNYNTDTKVDDQGKIVADKYVKLVEMRLGGVPIEPVNLFKICCYKTDKGTELNDTFWGFNGTVTVDFDQKNFIKYLLLLNNKFDLNV